MEGVHVGERAPEHARLCPYCHGELATETAWTCPKCGTRHHDDCARENGRCTLLGCGATYRAGPEPPRSLPVVPTLTPRFDAFLRRLGHWLGWGSWGLTGVAAVATAFGDAMTDSQLRGPGSFFLWVRLYGLVMMLMLLRQLGRYLRINNDNPWRRALALGACAVCLISFAIGFGLGLAGGSGITPFIGALVLGFTGTGSLLAMALVADQ